MGGRRCLKDRLWTLYPLCLSYSHLLVYFSFHAKAGGWLEGVGCMGIGNGDVMSKIVKQVLGF